MIKAEATGDKFSYGVVIRGYVDYGEYEQILENIEEIKSKSKHSEKSVDMRRRKPMSEKYTYADVIIDPEDPRVEVGKEYYFASVIASLLVYANGDCMAKDLKSIRKGSNYPFADGISNYMCIIRKKEPEKKYVPFNLSDAVVREQLWGKRIVINASCTAGDETIFREIHSTITGFTCCQDGEPKDDWTIDAGDYSLTAEEALEKAHFYDESPCGKLVEEE